MLLVELLQGVANGFHAAIHLLGNAPRNFRRATAGRGQAPRTADMISSRSSSDIWLKFDPRFTRSVFSPTKRSTELRKKPNALAAVEHKSSAHQALLAPAAKWSSSKH